LEKKKKEEEERQGNILREKRRPAANREVMVKSFSLVMAAATNDGVKTVLYCHEGGDSTAACPSTSFSAVVGIVATEARVVGKREPPVPLHLRIGRAPASCSTSYH